MIVTNDLSFEDRKTQKIQVYHLKEARARNLKAHIINFKVYIIGEPYTAKQLQECNEFDSGAEIRNPEHRKNITAPPTRTIQRISLVDLEEVFTIDNNPGETKGAEIGNRVEDTYYNQGSYPATLTTSITQFGGERAIIQPNKAEEQV